MPRGGRNNDSTRNQSGRPKVTMVREPLIARTPFYFMEYA
jgi:hypothetical protein